VRIIEPVFVWHMEESETLSWHCRVHAHGEGEYELHYFVEGRGSFRDDTGAMTIEPGRAFLTLPGVIHSISAEDLANPLTYYAFLFRVDREETELEGLLRSPALAARPFVVGGNYRFFFEQIRERSLSSDPWRRSSAAHQLLSFVYLLPSGGEGRDSGDERNVRIERALRVMQRGVQDSLDLASIAWKVGLEKSYFVRLFSSKMKCTPMRYYSRLKIEAASSMLISTSMTVREIADRLCFSSEFHFSRLFKAHTGHAPTNYRKRFVQIT
jgi:AraC-like DNA-binding protein